MSPPNLILTGQAGAGKSTAAKVLTERFPELGYEQIAFATPLKVMLATTTDRKRLQEFGTDVVRRYEPQAWVRLFLWHLDLRNQARYANAAHLVETQRWVSAPPVRWAVDDLRFPNEWATLRDLGWGHIEITAPLHVRIDRLKRNGKYVDGMFDHSTENALAGCEPDFVVPNDLDEDDLAVRLGDVLTTLKRRA